MATQSRKSTAATTNSPAVKRSAAEVQAAAAMVLEREEKRIERLEKRRQRQARQREKAQLTAVHRMQQSIEIIKWCIVGITSIMFLGIVIAVWTLLALRVEVEKVQGEIEKIQPKIEKIVTEVNDVVDEVERVRESLKNPMQSIGSAFGNELDAKLQDFMGSKFGADDE